MRKRIATASVLFLAAAILMGQNGNDLFQQALVRQTANGDYRGAIQIYERIVRDFSTNSLLVARTLIQLGRSHESLNQPARAREYYLQIVSRHSDQAELVREARTRLALLDNAPIVIETPPTDDPYSFAISPDGRQVVFAVTMAGKGQLVLHDVVTGKVSRISGATLDRSSSAASGGAAPFWSPDGKWIGFFSDQKLKKVPVAGGVAQTLADAPAPAGGSWSRNGVILFTRSTFGLHIVPADGTAPATLFGEGRNTHPQFLPDGRHFLFYTLTTAAALGQPSQVLRIGSLDTTEIKTLPVQALSGMFVGPDQLLYTTNGLYRINGGFYARRMDPETFDLSGTATRLLEGVAFVPASGTVAASASAAGTLAYRAKVLAAERQFVWLDRQGNPTGNSFVADPAAPCCPRISPDGRTIAFGRNAGNGPIYGTTFTIADVPGAQAERYNADSGSQVSIWRPDSRLLLVGMFRPEKPFPNLAFFADAFLREADEGEQPDDWSRDGRFILFETVVGGDLFALPIRTAGFMPQASGPPIPIAAGPAAERNGRFSPAGNWVAYQSNAVGGKNEVFLQPFPGSVDARRRVSLNGGTSPTWRGDGRELYFLSPDFHLMVVSVTFSESGGVTLGAPAPLFPTALTVGSEYDVSPDGQRFLINRPNAMSTPPIVVLKNWNQSKPEARE